MSDLTAKLALALERMDWDSAVEAIAQDEARIREDCLDWQNAAWLALLRLGPDSSALELDPGPGTVTEALAHACGAVTTLAPSEAGLAVIRARIAQRGLTNVTVAASEAGLSPAAFDLLVAKRFPSDPSALIRMKPLLKPDGVLVIPGRNRLAVNRRTGAAAPRHLPQEYCRRLRKSGFNAVECFWADPGSDRPYSLVPWDPARVKDYLLQRFADPYRVRKKDSGRLWLGRFLAHTGLYYWLVPELLFLARTQPGADVHWDALFSAATACRSLLTYRFAKKALVRGWDQSGRPLAAVVKVSAPVPQGARSVEEEYETLQRLHLALAGDGVPPFEVPRARVRLQSGERIFLAESRATGDQVSYVIFNRSGREQLAFVAAVLPRAAEASLAISQRLKGAVLRRSPLASWRGFTFSLPVVIPGEIRDQELPHCTQHGDFGAENLYYEPATGRLTILDWEYLSDGMPPLYDLFSLIVSLLPAMPARAADPLSRTREQFRHAFLSGTGWGAIIRDVVNDSLVRSGLARSDAWRVWMEFLLLRIGYFASRGFPAEKTHVEYLRLSLRHRDGFLTSRG
jgi:hypothetical protein